MSLGLIVEKNFKTWYDTVFYNKKILVFISVSGITLLSDKGIWNFLNDKDDLFMLIK